MSNLNGFNFTNNSLKYTFIENMENENLDSISEPSNPVEIEIPKIEFSDPSTPTTVNDQPMMDSVDPSQQTDSLATTNTPDIVSDYTTQMSGPVIDTADIKLNEQGCPNNYPYRTHKVEHQDTNYQLCFSEPLCALKDENDEPLKNCDSDSKLWTNAYEKPSDLVWPPLKKEMKISLGGLKDSIKLVDQAKNNYNNAKIDANNTMNNLTNIKSNYEKILNEKDNLEKEINGLENEMALKAKDVKEAEQNKLAAEQNTNEKASELTKVNSNTNYFMIIIIFILICLVIGGGYWYYTTYLTKQIVKPPPNPFAKPVANP